MAYFFKHPDLVLPDDGSVVWRYMDFPKFQSFVQRDSIFFSRADKQTDKQEGEYPVGMIEDIEKRWEKLQSDDGTSYTFLQWHTQKEIPSRLLSCWSLRPNESRKMWSMYTATSESIAIRSTIKRLCGCFGLSGDTEPVIWIGKVRYGEYENKLPDSFHKWNINYFLYPFFAKKESFRWENEVRAIVNLSRKKQSRFDPTPNGCFIKADIHKLIESVWIHPQASNRFQQRVESELLNSFYVDIPVYQSSWEVIEE